MPEVEKVTQDAAETKPTPDQSKVSGTPQQEPAPTQQTKTVSGEAFDRAVSRLTAEKWDLKRTLKEREDKIAQLESQLATRQVASKGTDVDQEFDEVLGEKPVGATETQEDVDARIARLENAQRLQEAANELQILHDKYPEVDPDKVLEALQKDNKNLDALEVYYMAERGRIADTIRAQRDAASAEVDRQVAAGGTEGPSRPATHTDTYDEIEDDVEAFKAWRRDKAARSK